MDKNIDNIEGDGFLFHLFHLLWVKDPVLGFVPSLNVPDTILFKYDQPFIWYFVKDKHLKRKSKSNLTVQEIQKVFLSKAPKCGVIALYISQYSLSDSQDKIIYEYMNEAEFNKFLLEKQTPPRDGVLQRFIQPKSDHNFILRAIWGPTICLFEKIENLNNINENKQDIYQRVLTFETDNTPSRTVPIRGYILPHKLENFVFNIVQHISNVTYDRLQVVRMVLNFKIDEQERIWFLFCSSLRLKNPSSVLHKYYSPSIPKSVYECSQLQSNIPQNIETQKLSNPRPLNLRKNFKCLNCEKDTDIQGIFKIKYKEVIKGWNFDHYDEREAWEIMKNNDGKKTPVLESKKNNGIQLKLKKKENTIIVKNELLSKKTMKFKKNTQFIYSSLFNEIQRENVYSTTNFFASETKTDNNQAHLIPMDRNYVIPLLVKKLHPHLKEKEYNNLIRNPGFLEKVALVCEDCYLLIIGSSHVHESLKQITKKNMIKNHEFVGQGKLNPELTSHRFNLTRQKILSQTTENDSLEDLNPFLRCQKSHGEKCQTDQDIEDESDEIDIKPNEDSNNDWIPKNKSSQHLNQILNVHLSLKKNYLNRKVNKLELSSPILNKRINLYTPPYSFEKISTVDSSGKDVLETDYDKLESILNLPKQTYLRNLSKHLNIHKNENIEIKPNTNLSKHKNSAYDIGSRPNTTDQFNKLHINHLKKHK